MKLEQIEAISDLSRLSSVDLFNLLGRAEQLSQRLTAERRRRKTETKGKTRTTDHGDVRVQKPEPIGTWPIMQFRDGQRVSITWFIGTLKHACVERDRLMANGGDFKLGIRKEDWKQEH